MSAFASQTFDSARYLACRPVYPKHFYNLIYDFHHRTSPLFSSNTPSPPSSSSSTAHGSTRWSKAVDLGCGPGFIAQTLSSRFDAVLGVDPSQKMIDVGLQPEEEGGSRKKTIEYRVGSGEDLSWLGDGEVDLVVVGQAAHWFDMGKVWKELGRVVGKGGSVALIGYAGPY
jgi:SAM-dependent methyltransferase